MYPTIDQLMERVGCLKWPERWREIYDAAMEDFDRTGCPYTDPGYYTALATEYGALSEELDTFRQAAAEVAQNDDLSRLLHLVCAALAQPEYNFTDTAAFQLPLPPDSEPWLGRDLLPGLAFCSQLPRCAQALRQRKLPEDIVRQRMQVAQNIVKNYRAGHRGIPGFDLLDWHQKTIAGTLFRIGRLELDVFQPFLGDAWVFRNDSGKTVALAYDLPVHRTGMALGARLFEDTEGSWLATVTETPEYWEGYPFDEKGLVQKTPVRLEKSQWNKFLAKGDPVVQLHIPGGSKLTEDGVRESLAQMRSFLDTYFPDYQYHAFACSSWLLDPVLEELLGAESNIVRFGKLFAPLTRKIHGTSALYFIWGAPNADVDLTTLSENTRLERALKQHYLSGKAVYEVNCYLL